jgi:anthranilate phosphoribosyltransferase
VVKHGNRAASSSCGSADVLEGLGIPLTLSVERVEEIAYEVGLTFCFAPVFHSALRHSAVPRRELGVATTFNFLGPLANPCKPAAQAVGVADPRMAGIIAGVLAKRGVDGFVFRGDDGLDELTTSTTSHVWSVRDGVVREWDLDPTRLGVPRADPAALRGGDAAFNADVVRRFVGGELGPVRDAVLLNAAAALVAAAPADGADVDDGLAAGLVVAAAAVDSGAAAAALDRWVTASQALRDPA